MNVSVQLTNVDDVFLKALKGFLKLRPEIGVKIKKDCASKYEDEILKELKETKKAYIKGEIKGYTDIEKLKSDLLS